MYNTECIQISFDTLFISLNPPPFFFYRFTWVGVVLGPCKDLCICPHKGHHVGASVHVLPLGLLVVDVSLLLVGDTCSISKNNYNIQFSLLFQFPLNIMYIMLYVHI